MEGPKFEKVDKNREIVQTLLDMTARGYILHGSKVKVQILEPRKAHDVNPERKIGKSLAIYGEPSDIRIPIIMALLDKKEDLPGGWSSGYSAYGPDSEMVVTGRNFTFTPGYVYVLPREAFEVESDGKESEYVAKNAIEPYMVIGVNPSILDEFKNIKIVE